MNGLSMHIAQKMKAPRSGSCTQKVARISPSASIVPMKTNVWKVFPRATKRLAMPKGVTAHYTKGAKSVKESTWTMIQVNLAKSPVEVKHQAGQREP